MRRPSFTGADGAVGACGDLRRRPGRQRCLLLLLVAGLAASLLGAFVVNGYMSAVPPATPEHILVIDAGSSGSRMLASCLLSCLAVFGLVWLVGQLQGRGEEK